MGDTKKFNPQDVIDGLKDKTKADIIELIPEEEWERMTKDLVMRFMGGYPDENGDHVVKMDSEFGKMVQKIWTGIMEEKIKVYLNELCQGMWINGIFKPNDELKKILIEGAPEMMANIMGSAAQFVFSGMAQNLPTRY